MSTSQILNNVFDNVQNMLQGGVLPRKSKYPLQNVRKSMYAVVKYPVKTAKTVAKRSSSRMSASPTDAMLSNAFGSMHIGRQVNRKTAKKPKKSSRKPKQSVRSDHTPSPNGLADMLNSLNFSARSARQPKQRMQVDPSRRSSRVSKPPQRLIF